MGRVRELERGLKREGGKGGWGLKGSSEVGTIRRMGGSKQRKRMRISQIFGCC